MLERLRQERVAGQNSDVFAVLHVARGHSPGKHATRTKRTPTVIISKTVRRTTPYNFIAQYSNAFLLAIRARLNNLAKNYYKKGKAREHYRYHVTNILETRLRRSSLSMAGRSSWIRDMVWIISVLNAVGMAVSIEPPNISQEAIVSTGRMRLPPANSEYLIASHSFWFHYIPS